MKKLGIIYAPRLSASAAALAKAVPLYRVGPDGFASPAGKRAFNRGVQVINWGSTAIDGVAPDDLNPAVAVKKATSKLKTLQILKDASVPALEATGEASVAEGWLGAGSLVLARKDGLSGGQGIAKVDTVGALAAIHPHNWDFCVKYWKKTHEYRIHVFDGVVIDIQQKRRRTEWGGTYDPMIRNFDNGWVFCHENLKGTDSELQAMAASAVLAVAALDLDFGAVDVLARYKNDGTLKSHVVCEINTAPGLEETTLNKYVMAIRSYLSGV